MAINALEKDNMADNREMKQRRYSFRLRIKHSGTPSLKLFMQEIPNVCFIRALGETAAVDAIEDLSAFWTTPNDFVAPASNAAPNLATANNFAVLAASTITSTGATIVNGDLGLYPGTSVTGFPPGVVSGTQHITDSFAQQAQTDLTAAYTDVQGRAGAIDKSGIDLGTLTLAPGLYKYTSSAQLTGTLTLDAGGNPAAVWLFQIGTTLTTASASSVNIINGGSAGNVFFAVGSSATLGTTTAFKGNILAQASITLNTGATVQGKLLARTAAITLAGNVTTNIAPTAPLAGGSNYGILIKGDLPPTPQGSVADKSSVGGVERIVPSSIKIDGLDGSAPTIVPLACGGVQPGISPNGNLVFSIAGANNLTTTDVDQLVTVEYYLRS